MSVLSDFQKKIGADPDGRFGPETLRKARDYFHLTNAQTAHFFGNCAHETGDFTVFSENLNYSAQLLMSQWPKYFPNSVIANKYARHPEMIANRAYGNRMGNGPEASGDGWRYRGRGCIQLTGKNNYEKLGYLSNPDVVATVEAFDSAKKFFDTYGIFTLCKDVTPATVTKVRRILNGGNIGMADVLKRVPKYYGWLD